LPNKTWTGNTSSAWSTGSNWSPSVAPGSGDDVFINGGTLRTPSPTTTTIKSLTIGGSGICVLNEVSTTLTITGDLTINSTLQFGCNLAVQGNIVNNGYLTASSTSNCLFTLSGATSATAYFGNNQLKSLTINKTSGASITLNGTTLTGVTITGTAGEFTCNSSPATVIAVDRQVIISGSFSGGNLITGYDNARGFYKISATNGSTAFTLVDFFNNSPIQTTPGSTAGLTFKTDALEIIKATLTESISSTFTFTAGNLIQNTQINCCNLSVTGSGTRTWQQNADVLVGGSSTTDLTMSGTNCTFTSRIGKIRISSWDASESITFPTQSAGTVTAVNYCPDVVLETRYSQGYTDYTISGGGVNNISFNGGSISSGTLNIYGDLTGNAYGSTSSIWNFYNNGQTKNISNSSSTIGVVNLIPLAPCTFNFSGFTVFSLACTTNSNGSTFNLNSVSIDTQSNASPSILLSGTAASTYNLNNVYGKTLTLSNQGGTYNCYGYSQYDTSSGGVTHTYGTLVLKTGYSMNVFSFTSTAATARGITFEDNGWINIYDNASTSAFCRYSYTALTSNTAPSNNCGFYHQGGGSWQADGSPAPNNAFNFYWTRIIDFTNTNTYAVRTLGNLSDRRYEVDEGGAWTSGLGAFTNTSARNISVYGDLLLGGGVGSQWNNLNLQFPGGTNRLQLASTDLGGAEVELGTIVVNSDLAVGNNRTLSYPLGSVTITNASGGFNCANMSPYLVVGARVVIIGSPSGDGRITDYTSSRTYKISGTNGSTTFTLVNLNDSAITTSGSSTAGLIFTIKNDVDFGDGNLRCRNFEHNAGTVNLRGRFINVNLSYYSTSNNNRYLTTDDIPEINGIIMRGIIIVSNDGTFRTSSDIGAATSVTVVGTIRDSSEGGIVNYTSNTTYKIKSTGFDQSGNRIFSLANLDNSAIQTIATYDGGGDEITVTSLTFILNSVRQAKRAYAVPGIITSVNYGIPWNHSYAATLYSNWRVWVRVRGGTLQHGVVSVSNDNNPSFESPTPFSTPITGTITISSANQWFSTSTSQSLPVGTIVTISGTCTGSGTIDTLKDGGVFQIIPGGNGTSTFKVWRLDNSTVALAGSSTAGWSFSIGELKLPNDLKAGSLRISNHIIRNGTSWTISGSELNVVTGGQPAPNTFTVNIIEAAQYQGTTKGTTQIYCDSASVVWPQFNVSTAAKLNNDMSFKTLSLSSGANLITGGSTPNNRHICTGIINGSGGSASILNASNGTWEIRGMTTSGTNQSGIWAGNLTTDNFRFEGNSSSVLKFTGTNGTGGGNYAECYLGFSTYGGKLENNLPYISGTQTGDFYLYMVGANDTTTVNLSQVNFGYTTASIRSISTNGINIKGSTFNLGEYKTLTGSTTGELSFKNIESGTVISGTNLRLSYSKVTGGAGWKAGSGSIDVGNNSGWIFGSGATGNFILFFPT